MQFNVVSAVTALVVAATGLGPGFTPDGPEPIPAIRPVRRCAELIGNFDIPGATTHVTAATEVAAAGGQPAHCDVRGYVNPAVGFQLKLPTSTFTGRYLQYGCDGYCGVLVPTPFPQCGSRTTGNRSDGDMAVAATDDGHKRGSDESWAADNQAARNDFFYRAPHVVSIAAKRLITEYYGAPPARSYFSGCSTGGREGLLLAQRYPTDFNGIVAGSPVNAFAPLAGMGSAWLARSNTDGKGKPILTTAKLPALHAAVIAACDHLDDLVDGQIDDPRACTFDPATLSCPNGTDRPSCLTPAQISATRKLYAGPTDAAGRRLYPGGSPRGSELAWAGRIVAAPGMDRPLVGVRADNYLKYLGFPIGTPASSLEKVQFTAEQFARLTTEGVKVNAMSLDLSKFRSAGGKLIIWHGWADPGVSPTATLDYYQRLTQRSGGALNTQQWARLFMVPTMYHCGGGYRLSAFDPLREIVSWVDRGAAPDRIIADQRDPGGTIIRSRPVFPYPLQSRYDGTGSIDEADNFRPARPMVPPHDFVHWVGDNLYDKPGPTAR